MESAAKGAAIYRRKPSRDWLEKINERASLVHKKGRKFFEISYPCICMCANGNAVKDQSFN